MQIPHHRRLVFLLSLPGEFLTFGKDVYMRLFTEVPKEQKKESARSAAGRQLEVGSQKTSNSKFLNTFQRQPQSKLAQSRQSRPPTPFHVFFGFGMAHVLLFGMGPDSTRYAYSAWSDGLQYAEDSAVLRQVLCKISLLSK